jgi:hypothetical protein
MDIMNYGIIVTQDGKSIRLYFTDDQHWDDGFAYTVIAKTDDGKEYAIGYDVPELDHEDGEGDCDYNDRCAESIDWSRPRDVERIGSIMDYERYEADDPDCSFEWFD